MRLLKTYIILFAIPGLLASCGRSNVSPQEYVQYVQDERNGLVVQENVNGIKYALQYQPTDYLVFAEAGSFDIPSDTYRLEYERFKGLEHYNFHIDRRQLDSLFSSKKGNMGSEKANNLNSQISNSTANPVQYSNISTLYLDFGIKKDIKLIEGSDTLSCALCECESDGGIHPYYSFIIGFAKKEYSGDRQFLFNGKIIRAGEVKLLVLGKDIKNIPSVKI